MPSTRSFRPYIVNGKLVKRYWNSPAITHYLKNVERLIKENQDQELAIQAEMDNVELPSIKRFHIGTGGDVNSLACFVLYRQASNKTANNIKTVTFNLYIVVTVEGNDPFANFSKADSYITAIEAVLETFGKLIPKDFIEDWQGKDLPEVSFEIVRRSVTDQDALMRKVFGLLPVLECQLTFTPAINR